MGVPDDLLGEAVEAYVVLDDGVDITEREILRRCRERLPLFAVPRRVVFVSDLPKTASGKVRRKSLRRVTASRRRAEPLAARSRRGSLERSPVERSTNTLVVVLQLIG